LKGFDPVGAETIFIGDALNRVVDKEIIAEEDLPNFRRSTMDGYALLAKDTFGASENLPAFLELIGEVTMARFPLT